MKRPNLILMVSLMFTAMMSWAWFPGPEVDYNHGNHEYANGQYSKASEYYGEEFYVKNSYLQYNLGNTWYKLGNPGKAVRFWLRAERLSPRDPDIRANLKLVQTQISKALPVSSANPITEFFKALRDLSSSRGWGMLLSVCIWGFWVALALRIIFGRSRFRTVFSILLSALIILVSASGAGFLSRRSWETKPYAVVVDNNSVSAKSGPGKDLTNVFNLPAGAVVLVNECRNGFCSVELPPGMVGWVDEKSIEKI
jgi:hypothetical protein